MLTPMLAPLILSSYQPSLYALPSELRMLRHEEGAPDVSVLQSRGAWVMPVFNRATPSSVRLPRPSPLVPILVAQPHSLWSSDTITHPPSSAHISVLLSVMPLLYFSMVIRHQFPPSVFAAYPLLLHLRVSI